MRIEQLEQTFQSSPFKFEPSHRYFIEQINTWWYNSQQNQITKVLSHPLNNQNSSICLMYYLINKLSNDKNQSNILLILHSIQRRDFLLEMAKQMNKIFGGGENDQIYIGYRFNAKGQNKSKQLIFMTFRQFVQEDLIYQHTYDGVIIETSNFIRMVRDGFHDYLTDTYLRRAYIEALRFQQSYRQNDKIKAAKIPNNTLALNKKKTQQLQIIKITSVQQQLHLNNNQSKQSKQQKQQKQDKQQGNSIPSFAQINNTTTTQDNKQIRRTFDIKRQQLLKNKKNVDMDIQIFQQNQLILLSSIIYIIGFFYMQLQAKKNRNLEQFVQEFQNKTSLNFNYLQKLTAYYNKIFTNSPTQIYPKLQQTYLHSLCQFAHKLVCYRKTFYDQYSHIFQIKCQKYPIQKQQSIIQQSTSSISINIKDNKIFQRLLKKKTKNTLIIQNIACPQQYWYYVYKKHNILINPISLQQKYTKIYGLHISKTPSNQFINFAQKLKPDAQTIKFKVCGVLLHDLSKFIPDGIIVYFHSIQGLQIFNKQMNNDDQKILKRIDNNKKIFYQSIFEQQNHINFNKFKKCCQIGRGAIFFLVANSKAAQYLKFYGHLSRCIVFFGLPKRQDQFRKDIGLEYEQQQQKQSLQTTHNNLQRIGLFNQCINNCVNDLNQYRSIIFVGREISNDLENWYRSFIRSWGQATRDSLALLRQHFQKMGKKNIW